MGISPSTEDQRSDDVRARIVSAALMLLAEGGSQALTTRAVSAAASVQAPTIYRLFGDKEGLMDAVAEQTLADFVAKKARSVPDSDPVEALRRSFIGYVSFGLENPEVFLVMHGRAGRASKAAEDGIAVLRKRIKSIALAGRLGTSEERAVALCQSMAIGMVLVMLGTPSSKRAGMAQTARDALIASIVKDAPAVDSAVMGAATTLRAHLDDLPRLTAGEKQLMQEWLERISTAATDVVPQMRG